MRVLFFLLLCTAVLCQGCTVASVATYVVSDRTTQCLDDLKERARNRKWAKTAWDVFISADPGSHNSVDYADGFQEGFANYLYRGGSCDPPPLPPKKYRRLRYQTPEGCRAIEDWFNGYRVGAAVAQREGYRRWVTGPSALQVSGEDDEHTGPLGPGRQPTIHLESASGKDLPHRPTDEQLLRPTPTGNRPSAGDPRSARGAEKLAPP